MGTANHAGAGSRSGARHLLDDALGAGQKNGTRRGAGLKGGKAKTSVRRASQNSRVVIAKVQHDLWDSDVAVFDGVVNPQEQAVDGVPLIPPSASSKVYQHVDLFESLQPENHAQTQGQYGVARGGGLAAARQASKMGGGGAARRVARTSAAPFAHHLQHGEQGQHARRLYGQPHGQPCESTNQAHFDHQQQHRQWASRAGFQPTGARQHATRRASGSAASPAVPHSAMDQSGLSVDQALLDDAYEEQMLEHAIAGYAGGQHGPRAGTRPWSADTFVGVAPASGGLGAEGVGAGRGARVTRKAALTASTYKDQSVLRSVTRVHQGAWPRRDGRGGEPGGHSGEGNSRGAYVGVRSLERASSAAASSSSSGGATAKPTRTKSGRTRKSSPSPSSSHVHSSHLDERDRGRRSVGSTVVVNAHAQVQAHKHHVPDSAKPYYYKEQAGYGQPVPSYTAAYLRGYYDEADAARETGAHRAKSPPASEDAGGSSAGVTASPTEVITTTASTTAAFKREASDASEDPEKPLADGRGGAGAASGAARQPLAPVNGDASESKGKPDSAGSAPSRSRAQPSSSSAPPDQRPQPKATELELEPDCESHEVVWSPKPARRARDAGAGETPTAGAGAGLPSDGRAEMRWSWEREKGADQCQLLMEAARSLWDGFGLDCDDLVRSIDQYMTLQCTKSSSSLDEPSLRCAPLNLPRTPRNHGDLRKSKEKIKLRGRGVPGEA